MADLTEEEYDALDEYYTKNPPKIDPAKNGTGFSLGGRRPRLILLPVQ
jgi:hypothetical protein